VTSKRKASAGAPKAGAKRKPSPGSARARAARSQPAALPAADGDAPLQELSRDELSVFLYAALLPEENLRLVRDMGLSVPGFRTEGLSEVERCDLIADEVRAVPEERVRILEALRNGFGRPPLPRVALDAPAAGDLLDVSTTEHGTVLGLWRVLADPSPEVRALAKPLLARMVDEYYGPPPAGEGGAPAERGPNGEGEGGPAKGAATPSSDGRLAALERELARAKSQADLARTRGDERSEKLQAQLKEARAAEARAASEAAKTREAAEQARKAQRQAEEALAAARATDAATEAQRARGEARELAGRADAAESRLARAQDRIATLEADLEAALRKGRAEEPPQAEPAAAPEAEEPEEAPASWLQPIYTREFYDSLGGWDRRIQRAAFKQAHLLALDHRHPSLRALALEGLPGYYRVRVATDVRLIYRRGEQPGTVEILSLIDREDLDRYVRQAKTR
jgi:mRNA-degrading endonuclease RelE of RelBE toxin-antitoxin system